MVTAEVQRPVTIAVVGTHSTGKSTFLARLAHELRRDDIEVATVADLGEQAQRIGLPILHNHTWASTLWIITRGISNEVEAWLHADVVLIDRAVPDALGYYLAALAYRHEQPEPAALAFLETVIARHSSNYDLILRTTLDPTIPLGADKPRDNNTDFRVLADHYVGRVLHELRLSHELLPANAGDHLLSRVLTFTAARLAIQPVPEATNRAAGEIGPAKLDAGGLKP